VRSPCLSSAPSQAAKAGTGDSVQNTLSRGNSRDTTSTTFLMRKLPSDTPRKPGWQLLIDDLGERNASRLTPLGQQLPAADDEAPDLESVARNYRCTFLNRGEHARPVKNHMIGFNPQRRFDSNRRRLAFVP